MQHLAQVDREGTQMKRSLFTRLNPSNCILLIAAIALGCVIGIFVPEFLSVRNITSVIVQVSSTGIMAIGLTFVIITGGIDLSLPTAMALSSIIGCKVMAYTQNVLLGILVILGVAVAIGAFSGFSIAKLKMVPMIVTLAISTVALGISNWVTGARSISGMPEGFSKTIAGTIFGFLPIPVIVLIVIAILMHLLLNKTVFGCHLFQVGTNEHTAKVNGVKTSRIIFMAYVISGLMAGLAGVVASARLNSAGPSMGPESMFMDIVAAVVIGGASISGGKGSIIGTVIGSLFIGVISNVMNLLSMDYFLILIIKGMIIVVVTYLDVLRNKSKERR